jgi:predicted XRE-type DNA-binding protein
VVPDTTLVAIKCFIEKYSLKQASVARGVQIKKATLNHYLVKGIKRNRFYERALVDFLVEMRRDIDRVITHYNENQHS